MAGTGIRHWEFANSLFSHHDVTVVAPGELPADAPFRVVPRSRFDPKLFRAADVVITQSVTPRMAVELRRKNRPALIVDMYAPSTFEALEQARAGAVSTARYRSYRAQFQLSLLAGDAFLCASQKQFDLLAGALLLAGRVDPDRYLSDPSLSQLLTVIPFGLPAEPPSRRGRGPREEYGLGGHTLFLWGGGLWDWLDPLTAVEAMGVVTKARSDVRLLFLAGRRPGDPPGETIAAQQARDTAARLGLAREAVLFHDEWVPYENRSTFLLDADAGISLHPNTAEARFAFRTRLLDYFWAGLPVIATQGDALGNLVVERGLGAGVPAGDSQAVAEAMLRVAASPKLRAEISTNVSEVAREFLWSKTTEPLLGLIDSLGQSPRPTRAVTTAASRASVAALREVMADEGVHRGARWLAARVTRQDQP